MRGAPNGSVLWVSNLCSLTGRSYRPRTLPRQSVMRVRGERREMHLTRAHQAPYMVQYWTTSYHACNHWQYARGAPNGSVLWVSNLRSSTGRSDRPRTLSRESVLCVRSERREMLLRRSTRHRPALVWLYRCGVPAAARRPPVRCTVAPLHRCTAARGSAPSTHQRRTRLTRARPQAAFDDARGPCLDCQEA